MRKKLSQLHDNASGKDPAKTLEALDHLRSTTSKTAREAAESDLRRTERLADAQTIADALRKARPPDAKQTAQAMKELASLIAKSAAESARLRKHLDPEIQKAAPKGSLTKPQLDKLSDELARARDDLAKELMHLRREKNSKPLAAAQKQAEALDRLEDLADTLRQENGLDPEKVAQLMKEMQDLFKKAGINPDQLAARLDPKALQALKAGQMKPEELDALLKLLQQSKDEIAERLKKLRDADLIDPETLAQCEKAGKCDGDALLLLGRCKGQCPARELLAALRSGRPGTNPGAGQTPLTLGQPTSEDGAKFKEVTLPPADLAGLKDSKLIGLGQRAPEKDARGPSQGGSLRDARAGGGSANTQVILPRHKGAVERFFDRPADPDK